MTDKRHKASVIIPAFNANRWATSLTYSLSNNANEIGEVIVINDGDLQDFQLLQSYLIDSLPNITFVFLSTTGRQGPATARNLGIDNARHDYIAFLDCDDVWLPESLRKRLELLAVNTMTPFVFSSCTYIDLHDRIISYVQAPKSANYMSLLQTNYINTASVVLRKSSLNGKRFPIRGHEDFALWLDILSEAISEARGLSERIILIRKSPDSLSSRKISAAHWHWNILTNQGIPTIQRVGYFLVYAINAILKRTQKSYRPLFFSPASSKLKYKSLKK